MRKDNMRLNRRIARWLIRRAPVVRRIVPSPGATRNPVDHVVILDGTNSSLVPGNETNAGLVYKLLRETAPSSTLNLHYEAGISWNSWRSTWAIISGNGINGRIMRAYGAISSRYQPGDRIFLIGFSRGGYAVRSLAGIIGMVGLLKQSEATQRNVTQVFRHYEIDPESPAAKSFCDQFCHETVEIECLAVWDTVKSLGFRAPVFWRLTEGRYQFHNHRIGPHVKNGYQALALDESREAFTPVLWEKPADFGGDLEQVWFRGSHGDIGGQLTGFNEARPRSNISLIWLVERMEKCGLVLPNNWIKRIEVDFLAPFVGSWRGWAKFFLARKRRVVGNDPSESVHSSVVAWAQAGNTPAPKLPINSD